MSEPAKPIPDSLAEDLLFGADEIALFLGVAPNVVYRQLRKHGVPIGKVGKTLIASRRELRRAFARLTTA